MAKSLKQIQAQLIKAQQLFPFHFETGSNSTYFVGTLAKVRKFVSILKPIDILHEDLEILENSVIFTTNHDTLKVQYDDYQIITNTISRLKILIDNFIAFLHSTIPQDTIDSVNITLPNYVSDFQDLAEVSKTIHLALTQVLINEDISGETKIMSVENGSIKVNVKVGTKGVILIAGLAWAAAVVYKKIEEARFLAAQVESLKINNFHMKDMQEAQEKQISLLIETEAIMIHKENFSLEDAEKIERIKFSIKTFAELIAKGAEFQPALQAPEEVTNLFPNMKNLVGIESKTKKISAPDNIQQN